MWYDKVMHYLPCHTGAVSSNNMDNLSCVEHHYTRLVNFVGGSFANIDKGLQKAKHTSRIGAYLQDRSCLRVYKFGRVRRVIKNTAVVEWRPIGHICLENSPTLLGVRVVFQSQTDCLQLGYVTSLLTATQGLLTFVHCSRTRQ